MKEIATKENNLSIRQFDIKKIGEISLMADVLKTFIVKQNLFTNIKGKNYAHVEGWQVAGSMLGLYPKVVRVENLSNDKEIKWRADVEIVERATDHIVSNGFAICSSTEASKKKAGFEEYAVLSMAQTRAIGKAYRNLIGWTMKLAGYESTPSEEMSGEENKTTKAPPKAQNTKSQIMFLLKELGVDPLVDVEKEIKRLTKLDPKKEENLVEIKNRLEILLSESKS